MSVALPTRDDVRGNQRRDSRSHGPARVAYVMSRFPKLTETFILYEILALEKLGTRVEIFPLLRARNSSTHPEGAGLLKKLRELLRAPNGAAVMHAEAQALTARARYAPLMSLAILAAQFRALFSRPTTYLATLWILIRANWGSSNYLAGAIGLFPKMVYFAQQMQRLGITHVHAHFANHPAAAAFVIHRLTGIPYSFTAHGADLQVDQHMLREKVAAAEQVITISEYNRQFIVEHCGPQSRDKVRVVHCGVDVETFAQRNRGPGEANTTFTILCIGTLYEVKGQAYLVEACRRLAERGIEFRCWLVGDGPDRPRLEEQVAAAGLADRVRLLGHQTRHQIVELLGQASVLVAPSVPTSEGRREGIPVVLMEGMASGLPVIASRISGIPELVSDGESGLLVPPRDPDALAAALERLGADAEFCRHLGDGGRRKVAAEFNLKLNAAALARIFQREGRQ